MSGLLTAIPTGLTAFAATNLDDIVVLSLFFSQVSSCFRRRHILIGQYLGFSALVIASLPSFLGKCILPESWIGLLGMVPIAIAISRLLHPDTENEDTAADTQSSNSSQSWLSSLLAPQTYGVAAITVANGGDNIGIYMPLFASTSWDNLLIIVGVFFSMVGVWCYLAYCLTKVGAIASAITRYGNFLIPFILIGLGISILMGSHTLETPMLAVIVCIVLGSYLLIASRNMWREIYGFSLETSKPQVLHKVEKI
ncbi:MAG: cadmium resistance transporter [Pelatocladus maniniholoensis HA4357-MV3]|jgi:cadmium resistance transport/sequestration family protein|uniref:Cadmium resistance transporter n=1 Tax=Pelatocladus maniniholoensis HA4357-MV3 TaxID=1117104 RepID=A0A9E3H892_9NOST|nr:cadmium resistance transporter [Pelatocladus maniniholoensis HA4357-MV3]BAZ66820.1 cadmium resistance transporter [Fischerella sp. NIES-4106]